MNSLPSMKFRFNLMLWAAGISFLGMAVSISAQIAPRLSLQLNIISNPIGPIEPLRFQLVISNTGTQDIGQLSPWGVRGYTMVEFRGPGSSEWQSLEVPWLNRFATKYPLGGLPPLVLRAGESRTTDLFVISDPVQSYQTGSTHYYFSQPGLYLLRAKYTPAEGQTIPSNEASFLVQQYGGFDAAAYEWLKSLPIPHFMYDFDVYADNSAHHTDDDAHELIARFPQSRFVPWAELFIARCYQFGIRRSVGETDPPDLEKAAEFARKLADASDPSVRADAAALLEEIERQ